MCTCYIKAAAVKLRSNSDGCISRIILKSCGVHERDRRFIRDWKYFLWLREHKCLP